MKEYQAGAALRTVVGIYTTDFQTAVQKIVEAEKRSLDLPPTAVLDMKRWVWVVPE